MSDEVQPCEQLKGSVIMFKWAFGVLLVVGGVATGFSIDRSNEAWDVAMSASLAAREAGERSAKVEVVEVRLQSMQSDIGELKKSNEKMTEDVTDIKVSLADIGATLNNLERAGD